MIVLGDAGDTSDGARVRHVQIEVAPGTHPFHLIASIALAEIMRQVG